jgi:osmotically-inducible protein OsmY
MRKKGLLMAGIAVLACESAGGSEWTAPTAAPQRADDGAIIHAIQSRLLLEESIPYRAVQMSVVDGIVNVTGALDTILGRRRVVDLVKATPGVRGVVNRIESPESSRSDADLRNEIIRGLLLNPVTEANEIAVSVDGSVATLTGVVDSSVEELAAARVAESVEGIERVESQLELRRGRARSDGDIAADVKAKLAWDPRFDLGRIEVAVEQGRVTLVGDVEDARRRADAANAARVAGVRSVDASGLRLVRRQQPEGEAEAARRLTDSEVRRAVADSLRYDPRLESCGVAVSAMDGAVALSGRVASQAARRAAEEDALNAVGVKVVDNQLRVSPWPDVLQRASSENTVVEKTRPGRGSSQDVRP